MKKIEFYYCPCLAGARPYTEIVEFDDDDSNELINEYFQDWLMNYIDAGFTEVEEGES